MNGDQLQALAALATQLSQMQREIAVMDAAEDGRLAALRALVGGEADPARRRALLETAMAYAAAGRQHNVVEWCRLEGAVDVERARATAGEAGVVFDG